MSLLRKLCLVVGITAAGECRCVYAGRDADEAVKALRSAPDDLVDVMAYKRPRHWKRRKPGSHSAEPVVEDNDEQEETEGTEKLLKSPKRRRRPKLLIPVTGEPEDPAVNVPIVQDSPAVDEAADLVGGPTEPPAAAKAAPKAKEPKAAPKAKAPKEPKAAPKAKKEVSK